MPVAVEMLVEVLRDAPPSLAVQIVDLLAQRGWSGVTRREVNVALHSHPKLFEPTDNYRWHLRTARPTAAPPAEPEPWPDLLGVPESCTETELKRAYRRRAMQLHPDHGGDPHAFARLHAAYEVAVQTIRRR